MTELSVLQQKIQVDFEGISFRFNEHLSNHTSFRIGGPAEAMVFPRNESQLRFTLRKVSEYSCALHILGAGTNILAPDKGLEGITVCLNKDAISGVRLLENGMLRVYAGTTMTRAAAFAANHGLAGMEFAHGIPGSIGGGVYMNAGAYGGEIKDICVCVKTMDRQGTTHFYTQEQMNFSYRHSRLEDTGEILIYAEFALHEEDPESIKPRMRELKAKRSASQPLDLPSAGSAFKRPEGAFAAALIDGAGLKGYRVGGAEVSTKHAGFIVNIGGASAADVKELLRSVSESVFLRNGIRLEPEVRIW